MRERLSIRTIIAHKPVTLLRTTETDESKTSNISKRAPKAADSARASSSSSYGEHLSSSCGKFGFCACKQRGCLTSGRSSEVVRNSRAMGESDNTHLNISNLATVVKRLVGDFEMLQSRVVDDGQSRLITPGSSDKSAKGAP